jgi:hypothetical protein
MIPASDFVELSDFYCQLKALDAITLFGIIQLGECNEDPEMITHILDLVARERKEVMEEFSEKLSQMRTALGL